MQEINVQTNEAGQRMDKLLFKVLNRATSGFVYKMLRKKNITLNGKKATGKEILQTGDVICLYLSDETIAKFSEVQIVQGSCAHIDVVYEDEAVLLLNKPAGVLSQKAKERDVSMNEELLAYLLQKGEITEASLRTFRPAVCNRLDRNTAGILICGKTLEALQTLSQLIRTRAIGKFYKCIVEGTLEGEKLLEGYLEKDEKTNRVTLYREKKPGAVYVKTKYRSLETTAHHTLLEVELITGKTHQIRSHFSSIGHPIVGDRKYGSTEKGAGYQALYAYRLTFPKMEKNLKNLSEREFTIQDPEEFAALYERCFG